MDLGSKVEGLIASYKNLEASGVYVDVDAGLGLTTTWLRQYAVLGADLMSQRIIFPPVTEWYW